MSEAGVFAVDRGLFDHPFFAKEPFTEREAWIWLISEAAWKPHRKRVGSVIVKLVRGQLAASIRFLAEAWRWHRSRVERFLNRLKIESMIETRAETGVTVVTICKYNEYQRVSLPSETPLKTDSETAARQQRDKLEDKENIKPPLTPGGEPAELALGVGEGSAVPASPAQKPKRPRRKLIGENDPLFMEFRNAYPARPGPVWDEGLKSWGRALASGVEPAVLIAAAKAFAKHQQSIGKAGTEYTPMASTWLNQNRWKDWVSKVPVASKPIDGPPRPGGWPAEITCGPDRAYRLWRSNAWPASFGPAPGYPGCRISEETQREWRDRRSGEEGTPSGKFEIVRAA